MQWKRKETDGRLRVEVFRNVGGWCFMVSCEGTVWYNGGSISLGGSLKKVKSRVMSMRTSSCRINNGWRLLLTVGTLCANKKRLIPIATPPFCGDPPLFEKKTPRDD